MSVHSPTLSASESEAFLHNEKAMPRAASPRSLARTIYLLISYLVRRLLNLPLVSFLNFLVPSFLQRGHSLHEDTNASTAWLDGMRGWASFFVYIRHFASATHPDIQVGYGTDQYNRSLIQLPFLRLIVAGPAMVSLFFIISGYALTWGPLKALHGKGGAEGALLRLSSATFRRAARLFGPAVVSTFVVACCLQLNLYDRGHNAVNPQDMPGFPEPEPPKFTSLRRQFANWSWVTWEFLRVWEPKSHAYDVHLWTLPVEFRCSIILFVALIAFVRCRPYVRTAGLLGMLLYCHFTNFWQGWLFFAGSFLAQLKFLQQSHTSSSSPTLPVDSPHHASTKPRNHWPDILRILAFVTGLYLLSAPDYGRAQRAPGYISLVYYLRPRDWPEGWRALHCYGGFLIVYATSSTSTSSLRWMFDHGLSRYLGNISYALYLVHGPVVHMLGFWLVPWMWDVVIKRDVELGLDWWWGMGLWGKELGFIYAFIIVTIVVVWAADVFWRGVDKKCVALARWFEALCLDRKS